MVTRATIQDLLISYFEVDGRYTIQDDLTVDTDYSIMVRSRRAFPNGKLPIKFGYVGGDFDVVNTGLTTLVGAPHTVGDTFMCSANKLTTLEHGPQKVRYGYVIGTNPLINLEGFPTSNAPDMVSMYYMPHLPLLKLLSCEQIRLYPPADRDTDAEQLKVDQILAILNKYTGSGKPGALKCAGELIKAGFKDNARW